MQSKVVPIITYFFITALSNSSPQMVLGLINSPLSRSTFRSSGRALSNFRNRQQAFSSIDVTTSTTATNLPAFISTGTPNANHHHYKFSSFSINRNYYTTTALSSSASTATTESQKNKQEAVPITLLSGFLGSGKTTALKNILENREGVKVGVVVNDVASVNIDAKLIASPNEVSYQDGNTVELQNGCACCSIADELLTSIQTLMTGREFEAIIVELSGVADPAAVKQNWEQAKLMEHPATKLADINKVVTVVDACTFGTDWMSWESVAQRDEWSTETHEDRNVPELLAEQVEAANILIVNKIDLAGESQVKVASAVAQGLNKDASLFEVSFGKVAPREILGMMGNHLEIIKEDLDYNSKSKEESDSHSHGIQEHEHESATTDTKSCNSNPDSKHDHSHDHDSSSCADPECTDPTHDHSHSHSHSHSHKANTSIENLGIQNFVYKAVRPFDTAKLRSLLECWPVPIKDTLDLGQIAGAAETGFSMDGETLERNPFVGVLRSKGFTWLAPVLWDGPQADLWRHDTAMFWSQAGKHFGITTAGKWWGSITEEQMKNYFVDNMKEYDRIRSEDWASEEFGDRRQEIVFIGTNLKEKEIRKELDSCLLGDEEFEEYRLCLDNFFMK